VLICSIPDDFLREIALSLKFFVDYILGKPHARSSYQLTDSDGRVEVDFGHAFKVWGTKSETHNLEEVRRNGSGNAP
jgi:hypothetical protein